MLKDFFHLFYPRYCLTCEKSLVKGESLLCLSCLYQLPKHDNAFFKEKLNQLFLGRVKVQNVFSFLSFEKGNMVQKLLNELKYRGEKQVAHFIGQQFAYDLMKIYNCQQFDLIIPVPLHYKKLRQRGFNQSLIFGQSLSEIIKVPILENTVKRLKSTSTQTKKSRYDRWQNVENVFKVTSPSKLERKHVLVVDDVLTTGATIEAMAMNILKCSGTKVSVATMAVTKH